MQKVEGSSPFSRLNEGPAIALLGPGIGEPSQRRARVTPDGQTLNELCGRLEMARQSATQRLGVLEAAKLISTKARDA
jgi:hypothetical protein